MFVSTAGGAVAVVAGAVGGLETVAAGRLATGAPLVMVAPVFAGAAVVAGAIVAAVVGEVALVAVAAFLRGGRRARARAAGGEHQGSRESNRR